MMEGMENWYTVPCIMFLFRQQFGLYYSRIVAYSARSWLAVSLQYNVNTAIAHSVTSVLTLGENKKRDVVQWKGRQC